MGPPHGRSSARTIAARRRRTASEPGSDERQEATSLSGAGTLRLQPRASDGRSRRRGQEADCLANAKTDPTYRWLPVEPKVCAAAGRERAARQRPAFPAQIAIRSLSPSRILFSHRIRLGSCSVTAATRTPVLRAARRRCPCHGRTARRSPAGRPSPRDRSLPFRVLPRLGRGRSVSSPTPDRESGQAETDESSAAGLAVTVRAANRQTDAGRINGRRSVGAAAPAHAGGPRG